MASGIEGPILVSLIVLVLLTYFAGMLVAWGWVLWRLLTRQPVFPEPVAQKLPVAPWGLGTVLLVIVAYVVTQNVVVFSYVHATGRVLPKQASRAAGIGDRKVDQQKQEDTPFSKREQLFLLAVSDSFLLVLLPLLARLTSGARLRDLGLSLSGWHRQVAVGFVAILITTPIVYIVQFSALLTWKPRGHPLEQMLREQFSLDNAYLAILTAVVLAPMLEELMFRAILLPWLVKEKEEKALPKALVLWARKCRARYDSWVKKGAESRPALAEPIELEPREAGLKPGDLAPADFTWDALAGETGAAKPEKNAQDPLSAATGAIVLSSLFFAAVHAPQWPAPIPIFVLAVALAIVYFRTGSLIAPIVMHATFNGVSTLVVFLGLLLMQMGAPAADTRNTSPKIATMSMPLLPGGMSRPEAGRLQRGAGNRKSAPVYSGRAVFGLID